MKKSTAILIGALAFFVGIVNGFVFSPIKKGVRVNIYWGNNSGIPCFPPEPPEEKYEHKTLLFGKDKRMHKKDGVKSRWNGRK